MARKTLKVVELPVADGWTVKALARRVEDVREADAVLQYLRGRGAVGRVRVKEFDRVLSRRKPS
jgi:hypothetical protein